jgi:outer membrane protein assembly factor BamA
MSRILAVGLGALLLSRAAGAQPPPQPPADTAQPIVKSVRFEGVTLFRPSRLLDELNLREGEPLPHPPAELAERLERLYHEEEYSYASVKSSFDETSATLTLTVDEGRIDDIEFEGVDESLARTLLDRFDVRVGDIFNKRDVGRALSRVLAPTHGAIERSSSWVPAPQFHDERDWERRQEGEPIQLVPEGGRRVLVVHLRPRVGRFDLNWGTDGREDWFTPVDGLGLALGFTGTVFDSRGFNHTVITGFASYKFARDELGYAVGFERPLFTGPRLFVGAELHDLTASDDAWRLSRDEQSLVALGFKNTFRDYYNRRGVQAHAALRVTPQHEILAAFRHEHHDPLLNETNYSFFRDEATYRENAAVDAGVLRALVLGYAFDSRTFERASLGRTYRRHQRDDLFGSRGGVLPGYRIEWTSEIASPGAFGGDFDFGRHIFNARAYTQPSPHQYVNARFLGGFSNGTLPAQRVFALGGIGSVRGYRFKEARGEGMALVNLEYKVDLGSRTVKGVGFFDAGRVAQPLGGSTTDWLKGIGVGVELGSMQVGFGWRLDDIPRSLQVLVRFNPLF